MLDPRRPAAGDRAAVAGDQRIVLCRGVSGLAVAADGGRRLLKTAVTNADGRCDAGSADDDSDGVPDGIDNCPTATNADQADADADGQGDACDTCPFDPTNDVDEDNSCNDVDNCPNEANADQRRELEAMLVS